MDDRQSESSVRAVVKYAGAFVAWVIGAGFATGQEILQFFSSYGRLSYAAILLTLAFFVALGRIMAAPETARKQNCLVCFIKVNLLLVIRKIENSSALPIIVLR